MKKGLKGQAAIERTSFSARHLKGQAAMEYLMTYGWAILVLVIVIAALYYFLPKVQDQCIFQQGFNCEGLPQLYVDDAGNLSAAVKLSNKLPQTIVDAEFICTNAGTGDVTAKLFEDANHAGNHPLTTTQFGPGSTIELDPIPCVDSKGNAILSSEGASFKGVLAIRYSLDTDVNLNAKHIATGTITGTVVK